MREGVDTVSGEVSRPASRSKRPTRASALAVTGCLLGLIAAPVQEAAADSATDAVRYDRQRDRLSVSVRDRPLVGLFEEISSETGVGLVVHGADHGAVTAQFDDLPLESALKRLLRGHNYAMSGAADPEREITVWIMAPSEAAPAMPPARLRRPAQTARRSTPGRPARNQRARQEAASEDLLEALSENSEAAESLQKLLEDENAVGDLIRDAVQDGDVPPELLELIGGGVRSTP